MALNLRYEVGVVARRIFARQDETRFSAKKTRRDVSRDEIKKK